LALFAGMGAGAREEAPSDILVAVAGPMTGQYAAFGQAMRAGAELAVRDLNTASGIGERKLQLVIEDDACDRTQAKTVAERLVKQHVALVIGHHCASASIAAAPLYAAAGIIQISPGTTDPTFTDKRAGATIFRLAARDDRQGVVSGAYLARNFAGKRVAILHDRTNVGLRLAAETKKAMNASGLTEALYSGFIAGERDYTQLARDLKTYRIDAVYLGAYPSESDLICAALRAEGLAIPIIASKLLGGPPYELPQPDGLDGIMLTSLPNPATLPGGRKLNTATPNDPNIMLQANAYAAIEIWVQAAVTAARTQGGKVTIAHALQKGSFTTILGELGFDKKGDATAPFFKMHIWKGGRLVPTP
jgi:branched-chain amino acid transport system substrate-binding protein